MGATNPANAAPGTVRKEFALNVGENTVHGSDAPETAAIEIAQFFSGTRSSAKSFAARPCKAPRLIIISGLARSFERALFIHAYLISCIHEEKSVGARTAGPYRRHVRRLRRGERVQAAFRSLRNDGLAAVQGTLPRQRRSFSKNRSAGAETPGLKRFLRTAANWSLRVHHKELSFTRISQHKKFRSVEPFFENLRMAMAPRPGEKNRGDPWNRQALGSLDGCAQRRRAARFVFRQLGLSRLDGFRLFHLQSRIRRFTGRSEITSRLAPDIHFARACFDRLKRNPENTGS